MMNTVRFAIDNRKERRTDITEEKGDNKINQYLIYSCMYALKYSEARRQYPKRLKLLFGYLGLKQTYIPFIFRLIILDNNTSIKMVAVAA